MKHNLVMKRVLLGAFVGWCIFFSWRYNPHGGVVFYSPLVGFSLLAYEVS